MLAYLSTFSKSLQPLANIQLASSFTWSWVRRLPWDRPTSCKGHFKSLKAVTDRCINYFSIFVLGTRGCERVRIL